MKYDHIVIDTSSLSNYIKYYYFDRDNGNDINNKLYNFVIDKIKSDEIIVIDKVYDEFLDRDFKQMRIDIKSKIYNTLHLLENVQNSMDKYYIKSNEYKFRDEFFINEEKEKFESGFYADLYLIEVCKELKGNNKKILLITEESFKSDGKLYKKIPEICKIENIECKMIPHALFEVYKEDLKFSLEV